MNPITPTFRRHQMNVFDASPSEVSIVDIARSLSRISRFLGHTSERYTVADHSLLVASLINGEPILKLHGLLHDAAEAYGGDITKPHKANMAYIRNGEIVPIADIEHEVLMAIYQALGINPPNQAEQAIIKEADDLAAVIEMISFFRGHPALLYYPAETRRRAAAHVGTVCHGEKGCDRFLLAYENLCRACGIKPTNERKDQ